MQVFCHTHFAKRRLHFFRTSKVQSLVEYQATTFLCLVVSNENFHKCYPYLQASALKIKQSEQKPFELYMLFFIKSPLLGVSYNIFQISKVQAVVAYHTIAFFVKGLFQRKFPQTFSIPTGISPENFWQIKQ